jgi:hypothetical protein
MDARRLVAVATVVLAAAACGSDSDTGRAEALPATMRKAADGTTLRLTESAGGAGRCATREIEVVAEHPSWSQPVRATGAARGMPGAYDTAVLDVVEGEGVTLALVLPGSDVDRVRLVVDGKEPVDAAEADGTPLALVVPATGRVAVEWESRGAAQATGEAVTGAFVGDGCTAGSAEQAAE